jgi:hypothetical protein
MRRTVQVVGIFILILIAVPAVAWLIHWVNAPKVGHVLDEALSSGRTAASFPAADDDYFNKMDGGIPLNHAERQGRNTWLVWSGGNDRFWDLLATLSFGNLDLLKTLSSYPYPKNALYPTYKVTRDNRWSILGLVNEPCFKKATAPNPERYGLWLDVRDKNCPKDPFEDERKYPGVVIGARGKTVPVGSEYGYASGVVGLRLFPNPAFGERAAKAWSSVKYYTDPNYYNSKSLIRPYRVGMSCGFCHVGPSPVNPPSDPNNPGWANLSSTVGSQYIWLDRIFSWQGDRTSFTTQLFATWNPGTIDTSLISTDSINNPRTMNAIYNVEPRLLEALRLSHEQLAGGGLDNRQINDFIKSGLYTKFYKKPRDVWTTHVLKDGSDSVGILGALNRVYINIGTFSEEWLLHFNPIVGGKPISPIPIDVSRANSSVFAATENQTMKEALFLIKASGQRLDRLSDAPGGSRYLTTDPQVLTRGKIVFAENCARCHSSKLPQSSLPGLDSSVCIGPQYMNCFKQYWAWTKTPVFRADMRRIVLTPDFLKNNYLSTDIRVPVTLLHTNACSPLATNAIAGNIWDNYSSESYKQLPSVGSITWYNPYTGQAHQYQMPAGGRGYTRVPSLISLWSTAPYLLNNSLGPFGVPFNWNPSVDARMKVFQASIEQMLWPEKRQHDSVLGTRIPGRIDRTTVKSSLQVARGYLPNAVPLGVVQWLFPWAFGDGTDPGLSLGPIPAGTPVDLIANLRLLPEDLSGSQRSEYERNAAVLIPLLIGDLSQLRNATDEQAREKFKNIYRNLLALSKCPDFVVNRGHYFGTSGDPAANKEPTEPGLDIGPGLSDPDKRALIEFLKTF